MKKIAIIIGARPQFIKHFSLERAAKKYFDLITIHTGQHYDDNMSQVFFDQLDMDKPKYHLELGGGSHGVQTGKMLIEIEKVFNMEKPDAVIVYGDTNSTLAGALVAAKMKIKLFHVEAGLRSNNKDMPEEINRVLCDHISDLLFVPSTVAKLNLQKEGITNGVHIVGDIMKDIVYFYLHNRQKSNKPREDYYYATLHRPYNVDIKERLLKIIDTFQALDKKVIFSIHPRTRKMLNKYGFSRMNANNLTIINPQPYFENLDYLYGSKALITDSGGMQKEAYWLEKKCVTIRSETEWIETLDNNCNTLVFNNFSSLQSILNQSPPNFDKQLYGDGHTSKYIVEIIKKYFSNGYK